MSEHNESRKYIEITPSTDQLDPTPVTSHLRRLHALGGTEPNHMWQSRSPPTIEILLVSSGAKELTYLIGVDDPSVHEGLERILRGMFPSSYNLTTRTVDDEWPTTIFSPTTNTTAIEYHANPTRRHDWQLPLTFFGAAFSETTVRLPLGGIAETLASLSDPAFAQVLIQSKPDWTGSLQNRQQRLTMGQDTISHQVTNALWGRDPEYTPTSSEERRLEALDKATPTNSFVVNARAVAATSATVPDLKTAFDGIDQQYYRITPAITQSASDSSLLDDIRHRRVRSSPRSRFRRLIPAHSTPGIVVGAPALGSFCMLGGESLPERAKRVIDPVRSERTHTTLPSPLDLETYTENGLELGSPLSQDDKPLADALTLPPSLQRLHVAWFGRTGAGKSSSLTNAILSNQQATDGADILIDPKGDAMCETYLRAHLAEHGSLDDVYYFDCTDLLPALSFFDVRPACATGLRRDEAVQDVVDHYEELLVAAMGNDRYHQAVRSPDIIRYLVEAQFDPVHGFEAFSQRDLEHAVQEFHAGGNPPPTSDPQLERKLEGIARSDQKAFDTLMHGVANRIEKLSADPRLRRVMNHVPQEIGTGAWTSEDTSETATYSAHLDFLDLLDEDVVVLLDTSGLRSESRRVLTLLILSKLWTALRRRTRTHTDDEVADALPLVNLYLEEAADVAQSGIVTDLLSQSRSFGLSVTLAMQFPGQLESADTEAYSEVLNNVGTLVVGNVGEDRRLSRRLATDSMDRHAVGTRLRRLKRGEWLVSLPGEFGDTPPRPFQVHSSPLPPGHPEGDAPLTPALDRAFPELVDDVETRTAHEIGVPVELGVDADAAPEVDESRTPHSATLRMDSALPHTSRFPKQISYDEAAHTVSCDACSSRYEPTTTGVKQAIECCASFEQVDRSSFPVCDVPIKLSPQERRELELTDRQLLFMQVVFSAAQGRFDAEWEYDVVRDSMTDLRKDVGIDTDAVDELIDGGYLTKDCIRPHLLYSVTAKGREAINESHREGVTYGHLLGDLSESTEHVLWVELGRRLLQQRFVESTDSKATAAHSYYEVDGHRIDAVAVTADDEIVAAVEAERVNNDLAESAPEDFDAMAALDLEEAIWIVRNREAAHEVMSALHDPASGRRRVEKTYSAKLNPREFTYDTGGLTEVLTRKMVQGDLNG